MQVRPARAADFLDLAALDRGAWRETPHGEYIPDGEHAWRLWCEHAIVLCAEDEGRVVGGAVAFACRDGCWCVHKVFVDPAARGRGVGGRLLQAVLDALDARGAAAFLTVDPHNERALRLYERHGFADKRLVRGFYREAEDRYVLTRPPHGAPPEAPVHVVRRAVRAPEGRCLWDGPAWAAAEPVAVNRFHAQSPSTHPKTLAKLLYEEDALHVLYRVEDRCVRAAATRFQERVCEDACVEIFLAPRPAQGYFNFEMNCLGTLLAAFQQTKGDERVRHDLPADLGGTVRVVSTLSGPLAEEEPGSVTWLVECRIPFAVLEAYVGPVRPVAASAWRANLYKCADKSTKPHYAAWAPIEGKLSFHRPECFGTLVFAP